MRKGAWEPVVEDRICCKDYPAATDVKPMQMSIPTTAQPLGGNFYPVRTVLAAVAGTFLIAGFATDLTYLVTADPAWTISAAWLLLAGSVASGIAAMAAFVSAAMRRGERREQSWTGLVGFCAVWGLAVASAIVHSHGEAGFPAALILSAAVAALAVALGQAQLKAPRSGSSDD